jgi:hypothetical protein
VTAQLFDQPSQGATFAPLVLRPLTPSSYDLIAGDVDDLAAHFQQLGYIVLSVCSAHELHRLRHPQTGGLAVIYLSGKLVCQGTAAAVHSAIAPLVEVPR